MQIVIDISEELYDYVQDKLDFNGILDSARVRTLMRAVDNGTPLPKGHGKLIDADDIDNHIIGHVDTRSCPTIIEADRESEG